jgi:hypothetical protein
MRSRLILLILSRNAGTLVNKEAPPEDPYEIRVDKKAPLARIHLKPAT